MIINNLSVHHAFSLSALQNALTDSDFKNLIECGSELELAKNHILYIQDSLPIGVYLIREGAIIHYMQVNSKKKIFGLSTRKVIIGVHAVITNSVHTHSAVALKNSKVLVIPKREFNELLLSNNDLMKSILVYLSYELLQTQKLIQEYAFSTVIERLAKVLLKMDGIFNSEISITKENLASIVGCARETAFRNLAELEEANLIELYRRKIKIINHEALERLAGQ